MVRGKLWVVLVAAALALPSQASASSAAISRAYSNPEWTRGSLAASVEWTGCQTGFACSWLAVATIQPSLPSYNCTGEEWLEAGSDPNIQSIWSDGGHGANGATSFDLTGVPILPAVHGQRLCVSVVFDYWRRNPVCVIQAPILGLDPEVDCPFEKVIQWEDLASKLLEVEPPPPPAPVAAQETTPPPTPSVKRKRCHKGKRLVKRHGRKVCVKRHRPHRR